MNADRILVEKKGEVGFGVFNRRWTGWTQMEVGILWTFDWQAAGRHCHDLRRDGSSYIFRVYPGKTSANLMAGDCFVRIGARMSR